MRRIVRFLIVLSVISAFFISALPCGPGYITPLFDTTSAPESPYSDFASGRLGIVKPELERSVLYAAYRYIAGNGLSTAEQQAIIEVWRAEIDNKDFRDDSVDEAVKAWVEKRKDVVGKDEKTPDIYAERAYGGYEFFPNCTKNAFETAAETLSDRVSGHGPSDPGVGNWLKGQDEVFANCASGKQAPESVPPGAPDWLVKDRAYQIAAASFYSLDYNDAKRGFAEIAQDRDSPWQETADYLVARTLIRQASLAKTPDKAASFYDEAETHLERFTSRTGKFSDSAERLIGLIKYRRHPQERVSELAKKLSRSGNDNFRQDLIDYNWLLNKFENEALIAEDKRKEAEKRAKDPAVGKTEDVRITAPPTPQSEAKNDDDLELNLSSIDYTQSWKFYVRPDATDDDAIAEAERVVGQPLSDEMKKRVRELRQSVYAGRFTASRPTNYDNGYYGDDKLTRSLLPDFLRRDDLTDWLYTFEMMDAEAYTYSLNRFKESGSELWLMSALSKADKGSTGLASLLEAANNSSATSPAYTTIAYHRARLLLAQGKSAEARKLIDAMLNLGDDVPISARNSFLGLRLKLAETLEDFLTYSLKKPYGFDFDGDAGTVDEIIARQKAEYNPEYNTEGREAYEQELDDRYKDEKLWQSRPMFDSDVIEVFNQQFSTATLQNVMRSPALPDYMRERFVMAIWTRAFLLDDMATLLKLTPELAKLNTDFEPLLGKITAAKTQPAMDRAALYFVLKNPVVSPYIEDGTGKTDNEFGEFDSNDWWCEPYDTEYDDATGSDVPKRLPPRPAFLTAAQIQTAQAERTRLKEVGDAPKFLAEKVMAWAKLNPADRRVPEALYIMIEANGWTKYGCGNNDELRQEMSAYLKRHYPGSEWTGKLAAEESDK